MPKVQGDGTVYQMERNKPKSKCRKWQLRVSLGRNRKTGKYDKATRVFCGTHTEAKAALRAFISEIESGTYIRSTKQFFKDYAEAWLDREKSKVAHGTWRKRVDHVKCLNMHLAYCWVTDVTPDDLEETYKALKGGQSPSGRKLSGTYLSGIASTAHKLFRDVQREAKREGFDMVNPAELVENKPRPDTKEKKALSYEGVIDLLGKLDPCMPTQLVVRLAVKLGLRRGEVHGLSWEDVDFDAKVMHVRHSFDEGGNLRDETKNGEIRDIPLTPSAEADLWAALDHQIKLFARTRRKVNANEPVVCSTTPVVCNGLGERLLPHSSTQWFNRHRATLGYEGWTIHEMRHTYRTQIRKRAEISREVAQALLGHSSETMSDLYDHVDMEEKQAATARVDW